jgi:hypothetical protein
MIGSGTQTNSPSLLHFGDCSVLSHNPGDPGAFRARTDWGPQVRFIGINRVWNLGYDDRGRVTHYSYLGSALGVIAILLTAYR